MNREELAWAAGLFDGEGSIGLYSAGRAQRWKHLRLAVGQSDTEVLIRFNAAVGGLGKLTGPYKGSKNTKKPQFMLTFNGFERCQAVVAFMWQWLSSPKRNQCRFGLGEAIAYYKTVRKIVRKIKRG